MTIISSIIARKFTFGTVSVHSRQGRNTKREREREGEREGGGGGGGGGGENAVR